MTLPTIVRARRASSARAALLRARGLAIDHRQIAVPPLPQLWGRKLSPVPRSLTHAGILGLVTLILVGELIGAWSASLARRAGTGTAVSQSAPEPLAAGERFDLPIFLPRPLAKPLDHEPLAPNLQRPVDLADAYQAAHTLEEGETLAILAERYGVTLESLVWANGLDRGDAMMVGQLLRIPSVSGLPHIVAEGESVEEIAEQFGVASADILAFPPNRIGPDLHLQPGAEVFVPGGVRADADGWLDSIGGIGALAGRGPEPAAVVRQSRTNMRTGPSIEHPRLLQLEAGRRVALRARHADWVLVELGPSRGWIRQDMVDVPAAWVAALPVTTDFPAPPPRWVWPARGTISSRFGPRWGGFHNGLDIANRAWTPIVAARAGLVKEAGWCSGYGYCVRLRHGGGVETVYGHMIARPVVLIGAEVAAGELIGHMGSTYDRAGGGYSTGVHLHFTVYVNGRAVDPLRFLP